MLRKSLSIVLLLLLSSTTAFTQQIWEDEAGTTFGIRAGIDFQNITGNDAAGDDLENSLKPAFNVGVVAEIPIAPNFYIQPGVLYTTKGAENEGSDTFGEYSSTIRLSYLEIPAHLLYKPILGNGNLIVGFGPYLGIGIGGEVESDVNGNTQTRDVEFKSTVEATDNQQDAAYFKRVDAGANFIVGYQFANRISVQLNAQLGLVDINPEYEGLANDDSTFRNTGFGLSIGYRF